MDIIIAHLPAILEPVIAAVVALIAFWFHRWTGIQIEAKHREALHSALTTGAYLALAAKMRGPEAEAVIEAHVINSVPDALRRLSPSYETLRDLIRARLAKVSSETIGGVTLPPP